MLPSNSDALRSRWFCCGCWLHRCMFPGFFAGPREAGIQNMTLFQGAQRLKTAEA